MRVQRKEVFDYEKEANRHMCEGCNKCIYVTPPSVYVRANECPHNVKRRRIGGKVRVGQGKGFQGGNR